MASIRKFLRLPMSDRCLLLSSALLLGAIRLGLWFLPFQTLRHLLACLARSTADQHTLDHTPISRVPWAVGRVGRLIPGIATCLTQALATQVLLSRRGHPSYLRIGVAHGLTGELEAHAWVESGGMVVIGDLRDLSRYTPLSSLDGRGP